MRGRLLGGVLAASTALLLVPAAGLADDDTVDPTCKNGAEPVHYSITNASPIVKVQLRLLCIRD